MLGHIHKVHGTVNFVRRKHRCRYAAWDHRLELLSSLDASTMRVDDVLELRAHGKLIDPRLLHMAANAEYLRTGTVRRADLCICLAARRDDVREVCKRLDIVHDRRL